MSLRKSPIRTPALLNANRLNAKKSTGPRTPRGKAWSRLNHMQAGVYSRDYVNFLETLLHAPPGRVGVIARALLESIPARHPVFLQVAESAIEAEAGLCREMRKKRNIASKKFLPLRSRNIAENKGAQS